MNPILAQPMKKILLVLLVLVLPWSIANVMASEDAAEIEAKGMLLRYLDALSQGDTRTLESLMAGDLLESRTRLLANPLWPAYLGSTFGDAEYSVERIERAGRDGFAIDVAIAFGEDDVVVRRFVLERKPSQTPGHSPFRVVREHDPGLY